jgi:hypothetical protein
VDKKRMNEVERLLKVAEDDLAYLEKQRTFLLSQISLLKQGKESFHSGAIAEQPSAYFAATDSNPYGGQENMALRGNR